MNSSRYRILTPAKYLERAGHSIQLQSNPGWQKDVDGTRFSVERGIDYTQIPATVLVERNIQPEWIEKLRLAGATRVIITFDDHYGGLQEWAPSRPWWDQYFKLFIQALAMADLVIVPSRLLADVYKPYCRQIRYVPNFLDDELWSDLPGPSLADPPIIGWGGSAQHAESWQQKKLLKALTRVLSEHPDWQFRLIGQAIPPILQTFPEGLVAQWSDWQPYDQWAKTVSEFTIGIAPLHGSYDRYRSNLKLVEYGLARVPWVASFLDPYSRNPVKGGVLVKETDWYQTLSMLVEDGPARLKLATAGRLWAEGFRMSANVSVYEELLWPS